MHQRCVSDASGSQRTARPAATDHEQDEPTEQQAATQDQWIPSVETRGGNHARHRGHRGR